MTADEALGPGGVGGVVVIVVGILVIIQPLSGSMGGVSLNWIAAAIVLVAGLTATLLQ